MWAERMGQGLLGPSASSFQHLDKVNIQEQKAEDPDRVQSQGLFLF